MAEALATPREPAGAAGATRADEVLVLDFGGQYSQLIARRVRDCGVFSELLPHHVSPAEIAARKPRGIILSGGPASVYAPGAPALRPGQLFGHLVIAAALGMLGGFIGSRPAARARRSAP